MNKKEILTICFFILTIIFVITIIGFEIYLWLTYGDKPVNEIPAWALLFLLGK